jgi:hypothetical protein
MSEDIYEKIKEMKDKKTQNKFEELYLKYEKEVERNSSGLVTTDKHDFIKFYSFYSEVVYPDIMKLFKAML